MMDPYNLAICFGPTLLPIPPDRDQVSYQASVNEIIKTIIIVFLSSVHYYPLLLQFLSIAW